MEFQKVVKKRRMVRHFKKDDIPQEKVDLILQLAQHAPSAGYSQGVAYVVVRDAERKKRLAELQGEEEYAKAGFHRWISEAPVAIVACISEKIYHDRYSEPDKLKNGREIEWPTPYWFFDAGASCMIVMLAAVDLALASAFTGVTRVHEMKELLGIPDHFHPVGVISIGYGDKDVKSPSLKRGRRNWNEFVHYERW
ncbi:MAG: nitroreductase family protein [Nitrososphaerota archaeon]